jgi:hypothetical protein
MPTRLTTELHVEDIKKLLATLQNLANSTPVTIALAVSLL